MSANINVNLNHCELTPSAEQSVHGEFIWLVNGANTDSRAFNSPLFYPAGREVHRSFG